MPPGTQNDQTKLQQSWKAHTPQYYSIFNNKYISDLIYIGMKPLELLFLLTLYTFDKKPENRIAKQYLAKSDLRW